MHHKHQTPLGKLESVKDMAYKFYMKENRPLHEVTQLIKEHGKIEISQSQLGKKLRQWNFRKRITRPELLYISKKLIEHRASAEGQIAFNIRWKCYTEDIIWKRLKKNGIKEAEILAFDEAGQDLRDVKSIPLPGDSPVEPPPQNGSAPQYIMPQYNQYRAAGFHHTVCRAYSDNPVVQNVFVNQCRFGNDDESIKYPCSNIIHSNLRLRDQAATSPPVPRMIAYAIKPGHGGHCPRITIHPSGALYWRRRDKKAKMRLATLQIPI